MGNSTEDSEVIFEDSTAEPLLPQPSSFRSLSRLRHGPRRGLMQIAALILPAFLVVITFFFMFKARSSSNYLVLDDLPQYKVDLPVNGPPTFSFRDNLLNDTNYITSWAVAGWTNDVMTYMNLIYLGLITERVPIIPAFHPTHVGADAGWIDFSTVFDVPRLSAALETPILEWKQVKDRESDVLEQIGCWTVWATMQKNDHRPKGNAMENRLKLDVAYTAVPDGAKLRPNVPHDAHASFWGLASLTFPQMHDKVVNSYPHKWASPNHMLPPDEHLVCYDFLYFVGATDTYEFEDDFSPAWRFVGKHTYWSPNMQELANGYLRRAFGVPEDAPIPPYIGLHLRHNDFKLWCEGIPQDECFAPLSAYVRRVSETKEALLSQPHPLLTQNSISSAEDIRVLVTSDDQSPDFWQQIRELGWSWVDHGPEGEDTVAKMNETTGNGKWYPAILDAVFQSSGIGFVGTAKSTMSLLAMRRVQDWHGGIGVMVKWGHLDADAH